MRALATERLCDCSDSNKEKVGLCALYPTETTQALNQVVFAKDAHYVPRPLVANHGVCGYGVSNKQQLRPEE